MTRKDSSSPFVAEALLEHADWLERLAAVLVLDPGGAADIAQETWLAALRRPPARGRDPKAWLATVARNAARRRRRQAARREEREVRAAMAEAVPAADEVVAKATLSRRVVGEVLALDEPYRSTLLLRFFEDLPPREIARRLERPVDTVRTHIERGLAKLRLRLDGEFGDRESWCVALLPFLPKGSALMVHGATVYSLGGLIMSWKLLVPVVISILALFALRADEVQLRPGAESPHPSAETEPAEDLSVVHDDLELVASARTDANSRVVHSPADLASHRSAGLVVDLEGAPVAGLELLFADYAGPREPLGLPSTSTSHDGRFEIELDHAVERVLIEGARWTKFAVGRRRTPEGEEEAVIVVARSVDLSGQVVSVDDGLPIRGARVRVPNRWESLTGFPFELREVVDSHWSVITDEQGRFELLGVGRFQDAQLRVSAEGFSGAGSTLEEAEGAERIYRLERVSLDKEHELTGVVLDAAGLPAAGAHLSFGQNSSKSDERGRFSMRFRFFHDYDVLIARQGSLAPAVIEGLGKELASRPEVGRELVLRLGGETWSLSGQVVDPEGEGRAGVIVELLDGLQEGTSNLSVESVLAGRYSTPCLTDAQGRFLLDGLFRDRYTVRARDPGNFQCALESDVRKGTEELVLILNPDRLLSQVRGVVRDRFGRPVSNAAIGLSVELLRCGDGNGYIPASLELGRTDAQGRFELEEVAYENVMLEVSGEGVQATRFEFGASGAHALELTVGLRLHFRLGPNLPAGATSFEAHDARGEALTLNAILPGVTSMFRRVRLDGRLSRAKYEVSDEATELVFFAGDELLTHRPLTLRRGVTTLVD